MHCISVISTLPYNEKDSLSENVKLDFANVTSTLSLMFGNSPEYGLRRQLISSSRCPRSSCMAMRRIKAMKRSKKN
jgi:hypothetical protein